MIKAGIIGAAGYTGGELIRLLLNHPQVQISFLQSRSNAGNALSAVHTDLEGDCSLVFTEEIDENADVIFFCAGHGEAKKFLNERTFKSGIKLIDIGNDFRLRTDALINDRRFVYGLPEVNRALIQKADNVANPGCFATAIQLALLPAVKAGIAGNVYVTGITGSTGAGQGLSATSHFSWRSGNIQAYKTLSHQHLGEIGETLESLGGTKCSINFVPWRGDFPRGIFISAQFQSSLSLEELQELYNSYYKAEPFTHVSTSPLHLKQVINTNKCIVQLEKIGGIVVVHSAIDNLLKGASGQAVQNMNLMFAFDETLGLKLKPLAY